jgi:hypothetical protein
MGRTSGFWEQDSLFPDGYIFQKAYPAIQTAGAGTFTRGGLGLLYTTNAASQTVTYDFLLDEQIFRLGKQDDAQQYFGQAALTGGVQGQQSLATPPGVFATPYQQSGRPPFTQAQNITVPTYRPKGIGILSVTPIYTILGAAATSVSIGVSKTVFANGAAPAVTALLAAGANGQPVAVSANPNVIPSVLTAANAAPIVNPNTEVVGEFTAVLPAGSTMNMYGLLWQVQFNYN